MVTDFRSLAKIEKGRVYIDHTKLDIFDYVDEDYSGWKPTNQSFPPYEDLIIGELDIETTGLDPNTCQITMIGIWIHGKGIDEIITIMPNVNNDDSVNDNYETHLVNLLAETCTRYEIDILTAYNGYNFDFKFIYRRCQLLDISTNFYIDDFYTILRNTSINGQPLEFYQPKHKKMQLIDTYCLVVQDDYVTRKLNSYSLKNVPVEWGMRKPSERKTLTNDEIQKCWITRDFDTLEDYLIDDLKDLKSLTDRLLPNYYYQRELMPKLTLQNLTNWGNGTKWNYILREYYGKNKAVADDKLSFDGGYTNGYAGLFKDVSKGDVTSLYPYIMLTYGICSYKDAEKILLKILYYLRDGRITQKALGELGDLIAKGKDGYMKVMINSGYGGLGTQNKEYNDYIAAAAIPAYGRQIAQYLERIIAELGGKIIETDTDGIIYTTGSKDGNKALHDSLKAYLPKDMEFKYEWAKKAIWIPEASKNSEEGQKKNYIMFNYDGTWKAKGKFVKRDRSFLERNLQGELINLWLDSPTAAKKYLKDIRRQISLGLYPVEKLQITRLVKKSEVKMPLYGFCCGEKHTFWMYQNGLKGVRPPKPNYLPTNKEKYSCMYYLELVDKLLEVLPSQVKESLGVI